MCQITQIINGFHRGNMMRLIIQIREVSSLKDQDHEVYIDDMSEI